MGYISGRSITFLDKAEWFNDDIINSYGKLVSKKYIKHSPQYGFPLVFFITSFFYEKLLLSRTHLESNYKNLLKYIEGRTVSHIHLTNSTQSIYSSTPFSSSPSTSITTTGA